MLNNLTEKPQVWASWEQPVAMLYACHQRVQRFCRQLAILPDYLAQKGVTQAVKNDVQQILNYFNQAAPLHHQDEELDFFPLLLTQAGEKQAEIAKRIEQLETEHQRLEQGWANLKGLLEGLLNGSVERIDPQLIAEFNQAYATHIALEEPLFELGRALLSPESLNDIGQKMAARRKP